MYKGHLQSRNFKKFMFHQTLNLCSGCSIQNETKLRIWEKLFIKKNEDLVMNSNIPSENMR